MNKLREWWIEHLPIWTWPTNPWPDKGRPDLPERHRIQNELQALSLRLDRISLLRSRADGRHSDDEEAS